MRRPETALFLLVLGACAYFYQAGGWNQNVRFDLVRSLVEQGTVRIDDYHENTGDLAQRGPHFYCDKAPGLSWAAVPVYAALHPLAGGKRPRGWLLNRAAYLATVSAVAVPAALAVVMLFRVLALFGLSPAARAAVALSYALGTLAWPYATLFYGHQLAASLLLIGFALLIRIRHEPERPVPGRLFGAGVLLGAVAVEYPAAIAVGILTAYAVVSVRPWRRLAWLVAGMALPALPLAAYHAVAFGGPFILPYSFSTDAPRHQGMFLGIGLIQPRVLFKILFSSFRGLFYSSPWLLLAIPGAWRLLRDRRFRAEGLVCVATALCYVALNASLADWRAGWGTGPRHLVVAIPFLAIAAAGLLTVSHARPIVRVVWAVAAAGSVFMMLVATSVQPEVPIWFGRPFQELLFPSFFSGQLGLNTIPIHAAAGSERAAWNLGEKLGLQGLASLLPLGVYALASSAWLIARIRAEPSAGA